MAVHTGTDPRFTCAACTRKIDQERLHMLVGERPYTADRVLCLNCTERRKLHTRYYPDCAVRWHDLYDHPTALADWCSLTSFLAEQAS